MGHSPVAASASLIVLLHRLPKDLEGPQLGEPGMHSQGPQSNIEISYAHLRVPWYHWSIYHMSYLFKSCSNGMHWSYTVHKR